MNIWDLTPSQCDAAVVVLIHEVRWMLRTIECSPWPSHEQFNEQMALTAGLLAQSAVHYANQARKQREAKQQIRQMSIEVHS